MSASDPNGRVYARIAGTGSYLPEKVLTNDDLAKMVDTSDEWIVSRSGIRERHIAAEGETTGDLAYNAAVRALEAAGVSAQELDLIVLGTHGESGFMKWLIGSVAESVLSHSEIDVLAVPPPRKA